MSKQKQSIEERNDRFFAEPLPTGEQVGNTVFEAVTLPPEEQDKLNEVYGDRVVTIREHFVKEHGLDLGRAAIVLSQGIIRSAGMLGIRLDSKVGNLALAYLVRETNTARDVLQKEGVKESINTLPWEGAGEDGPDVPGDVGDVLDELLNGDEATDMGEGDDLD